MVLIPREYLFSAKHEAACIEKVFTQIRDEFSVMPLKKIMISTKRNTHFVARCERILTEKVSISI